MESRLASLAVKEAAARELLASDAPPSLKRNGEAVLSDCKRRRSKVEELLGRCEVAIADLTRELKKLQPAYERECHKNGWRRGLHRCLSKCGEQSLSRAQNGGLLSRPAARLAGGRVPFGSLIHSHRLIFRATPCWGSVARQVFWERTILNGRTLCHLCGEEI
jgi:hypothetical protein